jgi:ribosomal-protein-alanine N-acetyltransferase
VLVLATERLDVRPVDDRVAAAVLSDRSLAERLLSARLHSQWPAPDLLDVLRLPSRVAVTCATAPDADAPFGHFGVWALVERDTRTVVGDAGFHGAPDAAGVVQLGYSIVPPRRRRGYATEAATALVTWALANPSVRHITASCDPRNAGSIRVLERVGFRPDGAAGGQLRWRFG